jgi:signal transduction histidine kinase
LENVIKHANASQVSVSLKYSADQLILEVSDDGIGFDEDSITSRDQLGIKGMRERAELIGGTLEVEGHVGQGITVRLRSAGGTP